MYSYKCKRSNVANRYTCICTCVYIYICIYICKCKYICITFAHVQKCYMHAVLYIYYVRVHVWYIYIICVYIYTRSTVYVLYISYIKKCRLRKPTAPILKSLMAAVSQHNANKKVKITIGNGHKCQC